MIVKAKNIVQENRFNVRTAISLVALISNKEEVILVIVTVAPPLHEF